MSEPYLRSLAEKLVKNGLKTIFGISGSGASYKLLTYLREAGVEYIPVSHEAIGPVAAGVAQYISGNLSASISIKGPGFVNALSGITASWFEHYPMLHISENYSENSAVDRMHKRLNQVDMVKPVVAKMGSFAQFNSIDDILTFSQDNPSPHYFELAEAPSMPAFEQPDSSSHVLPDDVLADILLQIKKARKPVLIAGSIIHRIGFSNLLAGLKLPVFTTVQAKGIFNEEAPNAAGIYTGAGKELTPEKQVIPKADLIIAIGLRNYEILEPAEKSEFVTLDTVYFPTSPLTQLCNNEQIEQVLAALSEKENWAVQILERVRQLNKDYIKETGWMPAAIFDLLNNLSYPHGLVLDTGTFCTLGEHFWLAKGGRKFIGSSNGRNMGISIPSALGLSLCHPKLPIFCVMGDGGIRYYNTEVRSFVERNLPVCFILMTDDGFGSIAQGVGDFRFADDILKPANRKWSKTFESMGVQSFCVDNLKDFYFAIDQWPQNCPLFIELPFDQERYRTITKKVR